MRKLPLFTIIILLFASWSMAQTTFSPTVMEITCPAEVNYDFSDNPLTIPLNISGVPGAVWLVINTHGKADEITGIRNGFLGWHYVNQIDTTVYVSGRYQRELGDVQIVWDGTNSDGEKVAEDTYSYYIWGYDDKNMQQKASDYIQLSYTFDANNNSMVTHDEQGLVREKPFVMGNMFFYNSDDEVAWQRFGTAWKWELGSNPEDLNNLATTWMPFYVNKDFAASYQYGTAVVDPQDNEWFYHCARSHISNTRTIIKWQFISGGDAEQDMDYMGWDNDAEWPMHAQPIGNERPTLDMNPDGSEPYMYSPMSTMHIFDQQYNPLVCINKDEGELVWRKELGEWFMPDDSNPANQINGCVQSAYTIGDNKLLLNSFLSCLVEMIDSTNIFEDVNTEDYIVWQNWNGDYFLDFYYWEDAEAPWACLGGLTWRDLANKSYLDKNMFCITSRGLTGTTQLSIATQDGTGIADLSIFGNEADGYERNSMIVDVGSQYDGVYLPPPASYEGGISHHKRFGPFGIWYTSFDSAGGLIVPGEVQPGVEETTQVVYAIDQNAPNPFNPTTTIGFTLAEAGDVNIDIYNIAGQKVDTLVSDFMESGSHSVVWNASGYSAGVYFYTIKSGEFSMTMKMTLLK